MPKLVTVNGVRIREDDAKRFKVDTEKAAPAHVPGAKAPKRGARTGVPAGDPRVDVLIAQVTALTEEVAALGALVEAGSQTEQTEQTEQSAPAEDPAADPEKPAGQADEAKPQRSRSKAASK